MFGMRSAQGYVAAAAMSLAALVAVLGLGIWQAEAAPRMQALEYEWTGLGSGAIKMFHRASALDVTGNVMYVYGGFDTSNTIRNTLDAVELVDPLLENAVIRNVRPSGPIASVWGAAGIYRSGGASGQIVFVGGANISNGPFENVQVLDPATETWTSSRPAGRFDHRVLHAAAYDPIHDLIVVHGGTKTCDLFPPDPADLACEVPYGDTSYLRHDEATGWSWERGPVGAPRLFGHTAVWDAPRRRVLLFGGTYDRTLVNSDVWALDLSGADPSMATWSKLATSSETGPRGRALHVAAYNDARQHMVIYGGAERSIYSAAETVAAPETWALDLSIDPPVWRMLGAAAGDRVAAAMTYDPLHNAMIMWGGRGKYRAGRQTISSEVLALVGAVPPPPGPTSTPRPSATPVIPLDPKACSILDGRVPPAVIANALANPERVSGYAEPANPSLPPGVTNPPKVYLSLRNPGTPYNDLYNGLIYKPGCP